MTYFSETLRAKFFECVDVKSDDECWIWTGSKTKDGYGLFHHVRHNTQCAHRYAKEMEIGERMPRSFDASHTCHNRACVNPGHIVFETHLENMRRSPRHYAQRGRNESPPICVHFRKDCQRFRAYRYVRDSEGNSKQEHLGYFETKEEALALETQSPS